MGTPLIPTLRPPHLPHPAHHTRRVQPAALLRLTLHVSVRCRLHPRRMASSRMPTRGSSFARCPSYQAQVTPSHEFNLIKPGKIVMTNATASKEGTQHVQKALLFLSYILTRHDAPARHMTPASHDDSRRHGTLASRDDSRCHMTRVPWDASRCHMTLVSYDAFQCHVPGV